MHTILRHLRSLPRRALVQELRRLSGLHKLLLWEQVTYGDMYAVVRAGPETAALLGVREGDVIGYVLTVDRPMGTAFGDLMNAVPQDAPPYPDPFR